MAGKARAPKPNARARRAAPYALTITWMIDGLSVAEAARLCAQDATALPMVDGRRPVQVTAAPYEIRPGMDR